jgi:hypothetical protein
VSCCGGKLSSVHFTIGTGVGTLLIAASPEKDLAMDSLRVFSYTGFHWADFRGCCFKTKDLGPNRLLKTNRWKVRQMGARTFACPSQAKVRLEWGTQPLFPDDTMIRRSYQVSTYWSCRWIQIPSFWTMTRLSEIDSVGSARLRRQRWRRARRFWITAWQPAR